MTKERYDAIGRKIVNDFVRTGVQSLASKGLIPPEHGVNKPIPQFNSMADALKYVGSLSDEQAMKQGGASQDAFDTPPGKTYADRRYVFLKEQEASRAFAYDDATGKQIVPGAGKRGLVTVGIGFNMDREGARQSFEKYLPGVSYDDVYSGKKALTEPQIRQLFDFTSMEAESVVNSKFKGVKLAENERLALVSLAFNSPALLGPKLVDAIKRGDKKAALHEVLNNSNKKKIKGLASRRYHEAYALAGLDNKGLMPDYATYISAYA